MKLSTLPFAFAFSLWTCFSTANDDYGLLPNQVTLEVPDRGLPSSSSLSELDTRSGLLSAISVLFFFSFRVLTGKSSLQKNCAGGLDLVFMRSWITPIYSSFQNNDV
jgi:hypothetical protein